MEGVIERERAWPEDDVPPIIDSGASRHFYEAEPVGERKMPGPPARWNIFTQATWGPRARWSPEQIAIDEQEKRELRQAAKGRRRRQQRERKYDGQASQGRRNPRREEGKRGQERKMPADALGVAQLAELRKISWMMKKQVEVERRSAEQRRLTLMANHNNAIALQERRHRQVLLESRYHQVMNWSVVVILCSLVYLVLIK